MDRKCLPDVRRSRGPVPVCGEQGGAGGVDMAQKIIDLTKSSIVNGIAPHYAYDSKSPPA